MNPSGAICCCSHSRPWKGIDSSRCPIHRGTLDAVASNIDPLTAARQIVRQEAGTLFNDGAAAAFDLIAKRFARRETWTRDEALAEIEQVRALALRGAR